VRWQPSPRAFSIAQRRCGNCRAQPSSCRYPDPLAGTRRVASCWWDPVTRAVAVWDCLCGSTPSMTRNMDVSLQLTGRGAVADSPTFGRHAHASVQSGHDRAPAGGMPTVSQPMAAGCLRAIPSTPWARYLTEQHAEHSQQVGCLPWLDQPSARSRQGRADRARCRPVKRQCPAPRHSPATAPHPLALDGCRQVSELLADQALEAAKSRSTQRVFWQPLAAFSGKSLANDAQSGGRRFVVPGGAEGI
jgi:hypothetical protein